MVFHPSLDGKSDQFLGRQIRLRGEATEGVQYFGRQVNRDDMVHLTHNVLQNNTAFNSFFSVEAIHPKS